MKKLFLTMAISLFCVTPVYGQAEKNIEIEKIETQERIDMFYDALQQDYEPKLKYTTSVVNIRKYPSTESEILDKSLVGTSFEVVAEVDGWAMITGDDGYAYICSEYLTDKPILTDLGEFTITHYCCEKYEHICGGGKGLTRTGTPVRPGIVSVDPRIIPLGSKVLINGQVYTAEDTGGRIKGHIIDMAVDTHDHALELGKYKTSVYLIADAEDE